MMKYFKIYSVLICLLFLLGCIGNMNPTGGNSTPDYPYYILLKPTVIKKIFAPKGTKLTYEEEFFKSGQQNHLLNEKKLINIKFPENSTILWAGIPITSIDKFFNSEMKGFSVYADFDQATKLKKTKFSTMWQSCSDNLGILVKDTDDWSFNPKNIANISDCSVLYQRYFKDDKNQQKFLDDMLAELVNIKSN